MNTTLVQKKAEQKKGTRTIQGTLEAINFDTRSTDIFNESGRPIEGYQRIYRPDTGKTLAIMSDHYKLVQHKEVMLPAVEALGDEGWKVKASRVERNGASAFVELERRDTAIKVVGDKVGERILMRNTYDGTSSLTLSIGAIVLVCSNGLVVPGKGSIGFNSHHTGDVRDRLGFLTAKVRSIEEGLASRMIESYSQLDSPVPPEIGREIVKRVLGERHMDASLTYWQSGIGRNGDLTAWNLYNGVTQYLTHDFTGGWGRRERKNAEALELIARFVREGRLPSIKEAEEN